MKTTITIFFLISLLLQTGCYWNTPVIDLLSPPRLTGEQIEIYNALISTRGSSLKLKYPKSGEFLSAFVFPPNEPNRVMVFYESADSSIQLTFLERRNNRWVCTNDIPFYIAADIEKVEFADFGSLKTAIITASMSGEQNKRLSVISFNEDNPHLVYERDFCVYYETGTFGDSGGDSGENMLLTVNRQWSESVDAAIAFARYNEETGEFGTAYWVHANPRAVEYVKSVRHENMLFLEYLQPDGFFNTEILVWSENPSDNGRSRPHNIVTSPNMAVRDTHIRLLEKRTNQYTAHAYPRDIFGDGMIYAAGTNEFSPFPGYGEFPFAETPRAAIWYAVNENDRLEELCYTFLGVNNDYIVFIPDELRGNITVTVAENEVTFWEYSEEFAGVHDVTAPLLRITAGEDGEYSVNVLSERAKDAGFDESMVRVF
jgi:hypothetical protein